MQFCAVVAVSGDVQRIQKIKSFLVKNLNQYFDPNLDHRYLLHLHYKPINFHHNQ